MQQEMNDFLNDLDGLTRVKRIHLVNKMNHYWLREKGNIQVVQL